MPALLVAALIVAALLSPFPAAGESVTVKLAPPAGCVVEAVTITQAPNADVAVDVEIKSRCELGGKYLHCESKWRQDREDRHSVDVTCNAPSVWGDYP